MGQQKIHAQGDFIALLVCNCNQSYCSSLASVARLVRHFLDESLNENTEAGQQLRSQLE